MLLVNYGEDDALLDAGPLAELLYIRMVAKARQKISDGYLSRSLALRLGADLPGGAAAPLEALIREGLVADCGDNSLHIVAFLEYQNARADIMGVQAYNAERANERRKGQGKTAGQKGSEEDSVLSTYVLSTESVLSTYGDRDTERDTDSSPTNVGEVAASGDAPASGRDKIGFNADADLLCAWLAWKIEQQTKRKPAITDDWRKHARLMLTDDGITRDEAKARVEWMLTRPFWASKASSPAKIRKNWIDTGLDAAAGASGSNAGGTTGARTLGRAGNAPSGLLPLSEGRDDRDKYSSLGAEEWS